MSDIDDPRDNPSQRVQEILLRTGTVSPWDFSRVTDEAIEHASEGVRKDFESSNLPWRTLGPRNLGGRIRCLVQDERNPRTIYAGSAQGGIWRTTDAGDSWSVLDNFSPPNPKQALAVGAIGVSYSNPEVLYVGTGEPTRTATGGPRDIPGNGLFRSDNYGSTFERIDHPDPGTGVLGFGQFENIVVDPWEPDRFWIASSDGGLGRGIPNTVPGKALILQKDTIVHADASTKQWATDVMVDFGTARTTPPNIITVYVALWGSGIFKADYNRALDEYIDQGLGVWEVVEPGFPADYTRIKLTQCRSQPNWIGAVAALDNAAASNVFISDDFGDTWIDTKERTGDTGVQARYDLLFGMHPVDPSIFVIGTLDIFLGKYKFDGGAHTTTWNKILDWTQHDLVDKAQHADQHAVVFDAANPNRIWIGNDGGVSSTSNYGVTWRERGLGINAAQFFDITTHPSYPYIYAGGLQDNGTWLSYGGPNWHYFFGGDGGETAFQIGNPREFYMCWAPSGATARNPNAPFRGIIKVAVKSTNNAFGSARWMSRLPDIGSGNSVIESDYSIAYSSPPFRGLFTGVLAAHPTRLNHILSGRIGAVYLTTDGSTHNRLTQIPFYNVERVTKLLYSPANPDTVWWVATNFGALYLTIDQGASWINRAPTELNYVFDPADPKAPEATITGVAINPNNASIIAISATIRRAVSGSNPQSRVYISGDSGISWNEISGVNAPNLSVASKEFNPSAATAIVFDPNSSDQVSDPQTLYVGCMAGIYVIRNAVPGTVVFTVNNLSFTPEWGSFNENIPLSLIFDLEAITYTNADGDDKHLLRCATHARGAFECDLSGAPRVRLLIRDNIVDDGIAYDAAHLQANNHDPRLTPGPNAVMKLDRAIDIRIDTPPYRFFGSLIDSVEFEEQLISDELSAGQRNIVYVQLHNYGYGISNSAQLHLYWARAGAVAPNLQSTFWNEFPDITDGDTWQKVDSMNLDFLESGQPKVLAFNWDVPGDLSGSIALLAVATDPIHDPLDTSSLGDIVDPASPTSFIGIERRTALFITDVVTSPADVSSRDGFDDTGMFNETAWGTQSYDIIVTQVAEATPNKVFTDLNDSRESDVLHGSATNHIYVRVHNQGGEALTNPSVEVFRVNLASINDPSVSSWQSLGTQSEASIPPNSSAVFQSITWTNPPDPNPASHYILVALIQGDGDPRPDHLSRIDSIESFWQLILEDLDSGNAAVRRINWQA